MPLPRHPLYQTCVAYKRAVVRLCAEQLREIEGRLEKGCGARWEQQLHGCDDLATVARLVLALQRRTQLRTDDVGWLEELSQMPAAEVEERAIDLALRLKRRLRELNEGVQYCVPPETLLGASVLRTVDGRGACTGKVIEHDRVSGFRVRYSDGDLEDLPLRGIQSMLLREGIAATGLPADSADDDRWQASGSLSVHDVHERLQERHSTAQADGPLGEEPLCGLMLCCAVLCYATL